MAVVMLMPEDNEEDWMKYASAGFGQTDYSLWDEETEEAEVEDCLLYTSPSPRDRPLSRMPSSA